MVAIEDLGPAWAAWLLRVYGGPHAAKRIAQAFEVDPRTAQGWMAGGRPTVAALLRVFALHGFDGVAAVIAPDSPEAAAAGLDARVAELAVQVEAIADAMRRAAR